MKPTIWGLVLAAKPFVLWAGLGLVYGELIWSPVFLAGMVACSLTLFVAGRNSIEIEELKDINAGRRRPG